MVCQDSGLADKSQRMALSLHGSGYNGFAQLSSFQTHSLDVEALKSDSNKMSEHMQDMASATPILLIQLAEGVQIKNVTFTWARIALTLKKDDKLTSVVTGFEKHDQAAEKCRDSKTLTCIDGEVVSSTDTHTFLKCSGGNAAFKFLHDGNTQAQELALMNELPGPGPLRLHGSHKDIYYTKGSMEFGKLTDHALERRGNYGIPCTACLTPLELSVKVEQVSCGKEHALILSSFGCVYSCGLGSRGQLGHGDVEMEATPRLIEALEGVHMKLCQAGGWHSTCVSECGDLYTWGWNESGQLGLPSLPSLSEPSQEHSKQTTDQTPGLVTEPQCVMLPQDVAVKDVACGSRHTLALSECGQVFACGWNCYGQLGLSHTANQSSFLKINILGSTCSQIFAGHWCSMFVCCTK